MSLHPRYQATTVLLILSAGLLFSACTSAPTTTPAPTDAPSELANPASAYCEEQGGVSEIRTAADGEQYGVCIFDNCTECEEWAYYNGDCEPGMYTAAERGMAGFTPVTVEMAYGWRGHIEDLPDDPDYDDKLVLCPAGTGELGVRGCLPEMDQQVAGIRGDAESPCFRHFWGRVVCGIDDYNGCQFVVERIQGDDPGIEHPPDLVRGWLMTYDSAPASCDPGEDALFLAGDFPVCYGLGLLTDQALAAQLGELHGTGTPFRVWGTLTCGVVDVSGCQIHVDRIEVE